MHRLSKPVRLFAAAAAVAALSASAGCGGDDPTRSDLAFVSSRDGDYAIFVMAADGGGERRLTEPEGDPSDENAIFFQIEPAWSADGARIAFASGRSGSADIYVMNADGTGTTQLTSTEDSDTHPTWSPDGGTIAFARAGDIYAMGADGSNARRISDINAEESDPAWSPDGGLIAYVRRTPGTPVSNVWVMNPDGSGRRALTRQDGRSFTPAWSPDGRRIVFATNADSKVYALFTIGVDGKRPAQCDAHGGRQLRAVLVSRRLEDRLPGSRRDLHGGARRRRGRAPHRQRRQRLVARLESELSGRRRVGQKVP